jgi:hypothetical protein
MDEISFLCVSLGSSTVQLHESLGSRLACTRSEVGFSSQNVDRAWGVYCRRAAFCCAFLWAKGLNAKDIHKEMFPVYGGRCLSRKAVHNWVEKSSQGRSKVADDAWQRRLVEIATEATALGCSWGLAYSIMDARLMFRKVCAQWVPRELKNREKMKRMVLSLQHLLRYADQGEDKLSRIVTEGESWCITINPNQSVLQCSGNVSVHFSFNQNV